MMRAEVPTPALLLDLDRFERNVQKMAGHVRAAGKKLRPHAKTHKCPEIARRQVAAGAVGVCVAKVGEAEVMAAAGVRNLLITTEVVGPEKIGRLLGVLRRQPETLVVVDHPDNIRELGEAVTRAGLVLNVLVESPTYDAKGLDAVPYLDAVATNDNGQTTLFILNRDLSKARTVDVIWEDQSPNRVLVSQILTGNDLKAVNGFDAPERVKPQAFEKPATSNGRTRFEVPARSYTMIRWGT